MVAGHSAGGEITASRILSLDAVRAQCEPDIGHSPDRSPFTSGFLLETDLAKGIGSCCVDRECRDLIRFAGEQTRR
jgi:hypothetical protein